MKNQLCRERGRERERKRDVRVEFDRAAKRWKDRESERKPKKREL